LKSPINSNLATFPRSRFQVSLAIHLNSNFWVSSDHNHVGYAGYIKGVKSENVYGQTYGKTTYASAASDFHVGRDEPANLKYTTTMKSQFINHSTVQHPTIAQTVGVERDEPRFVRVSPEFQLQFIANTSLHCS
jgi:hypothetical protein